MTQTARLAHQGPLLAPTVDDYATELALMEEFYAASGTQCWKKGEWHRWRALIRRRAWMDDAVRGRDA